MARVVRSTPRVWAAFTGHQWAVEESKLQAMEEVLRLRLSGLSAAEGFVAATRPKPAQPPVSIAVIPIFGLVSHRMGMMSEFSGGTSIEGLATAFRQAMADPGVKAIVFDVDSPGGDVNGTMEFAEEIFAARGQGKYLMSVANARAGSAALWLAAAADEVIAIPSAAVGSIGVYAVHEDRSAQNEKVGVKVTYIRSSALKAEGNPDEPLSDDATAYIQGQVNATAQVFVDFVAKARGVTAEAVREKFGDGRMLLAKPAQKAGLIDRVMTFEAALDRAMKMAKLQPAAQAADEAPRLAAVDDATGTLVAQAQASVEEPRPASLDDAVVRRDLDYMDLALATRR
jgi:signal peptide peptidase SppA